MTFSVRTSLLRHSANLTLPCSSLLMRYTLVESFPPRLLVLWVWFPSTQLRGGYYVPPAYGLSKNRPLSLIFTLGFLEIAVSKLILSNLNLVRWLGHDSSAFPRYFRRISLRIATAARQLE